MAPKAKYTRSRLTAVAAESASDARATLPNAEALESLTCDYVRVPDETTTDAGGSLRRGDKLTFRWRLKTMEGHEEDATITARTNHVFERGVPLPTHWWTAMQCVSLERHCEASVSKVNDPDVSNVRCAVLGQAKGPQSPAAGGAGEGRTVALQADGARVVFILCSEVLDDLWLCHRGTFEDGALADNPFQEKDLVRKDIVADAWNTSLTKRLRSVGSMNVLRALVQEKDYAWCELVAVARYRAAEARSQLRDSALDESVARIGFERSPWLWRHNGTWASQARVTFLWSWSARDGTHRSVFEHVPLNNVIQREVPIPRGMNETDSDLYLRLSAIAELETKISKSPCRYLGLVVGGAYVPDPQMWPPSALEQRKSHASVVYEWQYVGAGGSRHMATCSVDHLLHNGRRVPMNPLRSCPSNLTFDVAFFEAVGANVREGIVFKGVAFESDRPEILTQIPNEGVDVQREPVCGAQQRLACNCWRTRMHIICPRPGIRYWILPDGRAVLWSLLELVDKKLDELIDPTAPEAYFSIGQQLGCLPLGMLPDTECGP